MYRIIPLLLIICGTESAPGTPYYQSTIYPGVNSYSSNNQYPGVPGYSSNNQYPSMSSYPNVYQQNRGSYGNDLAIFPDSTRYPNYSPGSTIGYNSYSPYTTPRSIYGLDGQQNSYNTPRYGAAYGGRSFSSYEMPFMRDSGYCVNRSPQTGIWVDSLMGMWYGVEYVEHLAGDSRVDYTRTCIVIHIAEPMDRPSTENQPFHVQAINAKFRQEYRHLRLLWDEAGYTNEYSLYFRNNSAGYWQVIGNQNGTIPNRHSYQQFSGTIQVLKAVNDHLLLNFCQEAKNGSPAQLFSVLFSRDPGVLSRWELDSVHSILQNKKLSTASRRMVCGNNSAGKPIYSLVLSVLLFGITYAVSSS